jgi:hypothetical protein
MTLFFREGEFLLVKSCFDSNWARDLDSKKLIRDFVFTIEHSPIT